MFRRRIDGTERGAIFWGVHGVDELGGAVNSQSSLAQFESVQLTPVYPCGCSESLKKKRGTLLDHWF